VGYFFLSQPDGGFQLAIGGGPEDCLAPERPRVYAVSGRALQEGSQWMGWMGWMGWMVGSWISPMGAFSSVTSTVRFHFAWELFILFFIFMPHLFFV